LFKERNEEVDDKAFAARVETRRALVEDGDYFSILGVPRSATRYEIDRARDKLLQEYSDERLNARTIHLAEDLVILRNSIDEAHMVLCDDLRRLRYRTALEALPV
jgi:DnaJ-class molecular chaperone